MVPPLLTLSTRKKCGFALVLSLGLMALMVLLAVTLSALVQMESGASINQRNMALARQNALMGAYQAVGVLQQQLGPDQRVTARADINKSNTINPYWVGVWNTATLSVGDSEQFSSPKLTVTPQRWLVSMSTSSATTSSLSPSRAIDSSVRVTLVKAPGDITGSLATPVTAARIPISGGDQYSGGYAWWVSDEGMKASLRLDNSEGLDKTGDLNGLSLSVRRQRRTLSPMRLGAEALSVDGSGTLRSDTVSLSSLERSALARMTSAAQLALLSTISFTETRAETLNHDLTGLSLGVLASTIETANGNTLKVDLSTVASTDSSPVTSIFGASAQGIMAYLQAYRTVTISNGIPAFPLTPTVPDDKGSPVEGKAYFSVAPVLSELYFASSLFRSGGALGSGSFLITWPVSYTTRTGYMGLDTRSFAFFELWNPYSTAILPQNGHLSVRIKELPEFRLRYWYDISPITDPEKPNKGSVWVENTISGGPSGWITLMSKLKSSYGSPDYLGVHLLNQASTSNTPLLYHAGTVLYWFGIRRDQSSPDLSSQTNRGEEFISGYGAAKEFFKESNRLGGLTHAYYQSHGAHIAANFSTSLDIDNVRMPVYPKEALATASPYRADAYANTISSNFTATSLEWKSARPTVELWWVPDSSGGKVGDIAKAVLLSSVQMPANAASSSKPLDGEFRDLKYDPTNHYTEHYALHYVRKDAESSAYADGRVSNDWLTSTTSMDPRMPGVVTDAFKFFKDDDDPNNHFVYIEDSASNRVTIFPDINGTLKQQLDRKTGVLSSSSPLTWQQVHNYIYGSSTPALTSEGDTNPARKSSLFEIPTSAPVSLGVLQNVTLAKRRPFCIGNSWGRAAGIGGANVNLVFDRAYFSALTTSALTGVDPSMPLPNSNLIPLWTTTASAPVAVDPEDVLSYFLVKGAFNINSTSKEAWKSFLSGGWIEDWDYVRIPQNPVDENARSTAQIPLKRAFLRFSHTGDETFTAPDNTADMGLINGKYYRRGVRRLTNAQMEAMATIIVAVIKDRNAPYACMAEFLSAPVKGVSGTPSVLEYAVNPSDTYAKNVYTEKGAELPSNWTPEEMASDGTDSGTTPGAIDVCSPADLTQGALLSTLAPLLQARSDTFKIRAYGDVKAPDGQLMAAAVCEMTVQRMPDTVDSSATRKKPGDRGRLFKVVSIKWIQDS